LSIINPTVYLWTHATTPSEETGDYSPDDYATYNYTGGTEVGSGPKPKKNIGSGQGFVIRSKAIGSVIFNNSMRLKNENDQFFKNVINKKRNNVASKDRIWLNLTTNKGGFNQLLIGFVEGASDGMDSGYDAIKLEGSNKISFYSVLDDEKLAIQGLGPFEATTEIALGFQTSLSDREFTIGVSKIEGELQEAELILFDHKLNVRHDLAKSDYTFDQDIEGEFNDRFTLKFEKEQIDEELDIIIEDEFQFHNQGDLFIVSAPKKMKTIRLYDLQGRLIRQIHPNQNSFEFTETNFKRGEVIIMQVIQEGQSEVIKKLYKQ